MKKAKIMATILVFVLLASLTVLPVCATSNPFDNLNDAAAGKNPLMNPQFIDGGEGAAAIEGSASLFVYDEDSEDFPKYCTKIMPYWAEWKYDQEYVVDRVILRTGGDSEEFPRRMGDGWTISGSNDGSSWTEIYKGKTDDVENTNNTYYYIDINNSAAYQYYRLYSENGAEENQESEGLKIVQYSMLILCGNVPAAADDGEAGDAGDSGSSSSEDESGNSILIIIIIAAVVVVAVVVVIIVMSKKKK